MCTDYSELNTNFKANLNTLKINLFNVSKTTFETIIQTTNFRSSLLKLGIGIVAKLYCNRHPHRTISNVDSICISYSINNIIRNVSVILYRISLIQPLKYHSKHPQTRID